MILPPWRNELRRINPFYLTSLLESLNTRTRLYYDDDDDDDNSFFKLLLNPKFEWGRCSPWWRKNKTKKYPEIHKVAVRNQKWVPAGADNTSGPFHKYVTKLLIIRVINVEHVSIMDGHTWREWTQPITINRPRVNERFVSAGYHEFEVIFVKQIKKNIYINKWIPSNIQTFQQCVSAPDSSCSLGASFRSLKEFYVKVRFKKKNIFGPCMHVEWQYRNKIRF